MAGAPSNVINVPQADGSTTSYAPGYEPGGQFAPTTPTPTPAPTPAAPINRTVDTSTQPNNDPTTAEGYLNTFTPPQTADQIAETKRQAAQAQIDALNKTYDDQVASEQKAGQQRTNQNNAISVLSGLSGSTEAVRTDNEVSAANAKNVDAIQNQRAAAVNAIYSKINDEAATEAEQQKQDAQKSAEDIIARRTQVQTDAVNNIKLLASGGESYDTFKSTATPDAYQHAVDALGSEDALKASFIVNRPQSQLVGTPTRVGNNYVQAYKDPVTDKVTMENIPLPAGLGTNYSTFQKVGDNLVAIPDDWSGDTSQLKTIAGQPSALEQAQTAEANASAAKTRSEISSGGSGANNVDIVTSTGHSMNVPVDVAPYVNTSSSGVPYADLSTVQGTAREKKAVVDAAQKAGIKVITNKNTALDLTNIQDAKSKLNSIATIMAGIDQPNALSRDLAGFGLTKLATMAQSNPQQAAAGALQGVGLDILKAISGVQGFRGNAAVVQQVTEHLPSIYDTDAVVQQKVAYINKLISDREDAIVGKPSDASSSSNSGSDPLGLGI